VKLGLAIPSPDMFSEARSSEMTLKDTRIRGHALSCTNHYVSQIGYDTVTDKKNVRRTTKDYDREQPNFLRMLENKSKSHYDR
jgi:hypothetical protein